MKVLKGQYTGRGWLTVSGCSVVAVGVLVSMVVALAVVVVVVGVLY